MHKYGTILALMLIGLCTAVSIGLADDQDYNAADDARIDKTGTACAAESTVVDETPVGVLLNELGDDRTPRPQPLCPDTSSTGNVYAGETITLNAAPCDTSKFAYTWRTFIGSSSGTSSDTDCSIDLVVPGTTPSWTTVGAKVTIENKYQRACMDDECVKFTVIPLPCCPDPASYCKTKADATTVATFAFNGLMTGYSGRPVIDGSEQNPLTPGYLNSLDAGEWHTVSWNIYKGTTKIRSYVCGQSFFVYTTPVASISRA
jgi:hypothetical protein